MLEGLAPIVGEHPNILILGSMPSETSLKQVEYYGHKTNRFWPFLSKIFDMPIDSYDEKLAILYTNNIALWDVIARCERKGSLDQAIRKVEVNDLKRFLQTYPTIQKIICNGKKSYDLFQKYFSHVNQEVIYLPSTSSANRMYREEQLFQQWKQHLSQE